MSIKLSRFLTVRIVDNKVISLEAQHESFGIRLFGSTMPTSTKRVQLYSGISQLTIYPEQGAEGIVAIVAVLTSRDNKGGTIYDHVPAFLKVVWREKDGQKYPFIDLDEPWISVDRIGQVTNETVEIMLKNGMRFCTHDHYAWDHNKDKDLPGYVQDGDLLCRYLWRTAHATDVLHAVVQKKLEPIRQKRIEELEAGARNLEATSNIFEQAAANYRTRLAESGLENQTLAKKNSQLESKLAEAATKQKKPNRFFWWLERRAMLGK